MATTQIDVVVNAVKLPDGMLTRSHLVLLDGADRTQFFGAGIETIHDANSSFASATFPVQLPFDLGPGFHTIQWFVGWNVDRSHLAGRGDLLAFKGEVVGRGQRYYRHTEVLTAGGALKRLEEGLDQARAFYWSGAPELAATIPADFLAVPIDTDGDIIIHILECYGITPATWNHRIEASGHPRARLAPILWEAGQPGWSIVAELDRISNYRTFDGRTGAVYRRQVQGKVPSRVKHTFVEGLDILDLTPDTTYTVFNQVVITGGELPADPAFPEVDQGVVIAVLPANPAPSVWIPNPPGVRTDRSISSDYIETIDDANATALEQLAIVAQPLMTLPLTTFGLSDYDVGDALAVSSPTLDLDGVTAFVSRHALRGDPYRSVLDLRGSSDAVMLPPDTGMPPQPEALITVVRETVIIAGSPAAVAMITVDAGTSSDPDGTIDTISIVIEGTTYPGPRATHLTTSASPVPVSVTVSDNDGLTATLNAEAAWTPDSIVQEPVTTAELIRAAATQDGEESWQTADGPYTAVAPIALGAVTLYGREDGGIDRSLDHLQTPPAQVTPGWGSPIMCLWNNEKSVDRWLAGLADGRIFVSSDRGQTWTLFGQPSGAPINDLSESPDAPGSVTVATGSSLLHTFNGVDWDVLIEGDGSCLRFCAAGYNGIPTVYAGWADGTVRRKAEGLASVLLFTTDPPAAIRGMTSAIAREELYVFTDSTATFIWEPNTGVRAGPPTGTATNRAIRSGTGRWVLVATDGALMKWLPDQAQCYDIRIADAGARVLSVGYHAAGAIVVPPPPPPPPVDVEVMVPTWHISGGSRGGVWHYVPGAGGAAGTWTLLSNGLPVRWRWRWLTVDPYDSGHLMLVGDTGADRDVGYYGALPDGRLIVRHGAGFPGTSPIWESFDRGASWTECILPALSADITVGGGDYGEGINFPDTHAFTMLRPVPQPDGLVVVYGVLDGVQYWNNDPEPGIVRWRRPLGGEWETIEYARRSSILHGVTQTGVGGDVIISRVQYVDGRHGPRHGGLEGVGQHSAAATVSWDLSVLSGPGAILPVGIAPWVVAVHQATRRLWGLKKASFSDANPDPYIDDSGGLWIWPDYRHTSSDPSPANGYAPYDPREAWIAVDQSQRVWMVTKKSSKFTMLPPATPDAPVETTPDATFPRGYLYMAGSTDNSCAVGVGYSSTSQNTDFAVFDGTAWSLLERPNRTDQWIMAVALGVPVDES